MRVAASRRPRQAPRLAGDTRGCVRHEAHSRAFQRAVDPRRVQTRARQRRPIPEYSGPVDTKLRTLALAFVLLGASAPTLAGCAPYTVVQQSGPPSALQGVQQVAVSFDWSQVSVVGKTEAAYLSEKTAEEQADFQVIKQETDAAILQGLQANAGAGVTFVIAAAGTDAAMPAVAVQYAEVQTGIYTYVVNLPSKVRARFLWSRDGKVTDVIETRAMIGASVTTPSDHQRMGMAGKNLGRAAGKFFVNAQGGT